MAITGQDLAKLVDAFSSDCATCNISVTATGGASSFNAASADVSYVNDGGFGSGPIGMA